MVYQSKSSQTMKANTTHVKSERLQESGRSTTLLAAPRSNGMAEKEMWRIEPRCYERTVNPHEHTAKMWQITSRTQDGKNTKRQSATITANNIVQTTISVTRTDRRWTLSRQKNTEPYITKWIFTEPKSCNPGRVHTRMDTKGSIIDIVVPYDLAPSRWTMETFFAKINVTYTKYTQLLFIKLKEWRRVRRMLNLWKGTLTPTQTVHLHTK